METKFEKREHGSGHSYFYDGKRMTGVTTIIGIIDKPQLIQWSANMAVDYLKGHSDTEKKGIDNFWTYSIREEELENARTAWTRKRDSAGDIGTVVHKQIEEYVKSKLKGETPKPIEGDEQVKKMVGKFLEWEQENNVKFLLSEQAVYSLKNFYAGTLDLVVEIKGKKYIADIKTAKDIYTTNYIQMAGYDIALEELGKMKDLEGYIVINIPKEFNSNGDAKIKTKTLSNTSELKKAFLNCVELYRFINKEKPTWQKNKK